MMVVNALLAVDASLTGDEIASFTVRPGAVEDASQIFRVSADDSMVTVRYRSEVDNSWVYLDMELVDANEEEPIAAFGDEIGYYHGSDWSEGSRKRTRHFKGVPAGEYRLVASSEHDVPVSTAVTVTEGERLARFNILTAVLLACLGLFLLWRYHAFEQQRFRDDDGEWNTPDLLDLID